MSFSIAGKTAIITGAANGCGLAIGRHFVEEGANVVFADIDEEALHAQLDDLAETHEQVRIFSGDLRQKLTIANLLSTTLDAFDEVDILVNGARRISGSDPLDPCNDQMTDTLDQNLLVPLRMSQAVARQMIKQGEGGERPCLGAIINLSSIAARRTQPELMAYSIAAAGLEQMTRAMAVSLAPHRIRINAVAFGSLMSASLKQALREDAPLRRRIIEATPMERIASPAELAHTVQYLASEASSFTTGQVVTVDGGRTLIDPVSSPAH